MNVLDLFSGIGGFSLGLDAVGNFNTVGFVEWDATAQQVLRNHWPYLPVFGDIRQVDKELLESSGVSKVDVLTGGFPCTDLSQSAKGSHLGFEGQASSLVYEFGRLAKELCPEYVLIENVPQVKKYKTELENIFENYRLTFTDADALDFGAYCRRKRTFIVGHLRSRGGREISFIPQSNIKALSTGGLKDNAPMLLPWKGGASLERLSSCIVESAEVDSTRIRIGARIPKRVGDGKLYLLLGNSLSPLITKQIGEAIVKDALQASSSQEISCS